MPEHNLLILLCSLLSNASSSSVSSSCPVLPSSPCARRISSASGRCRWIAACRAARRAFGYPPPHPDASMHARDPLMAAQTRSALPASSTQVLWGWLQSRCWNLNCPKNCPGNVLYCSALLLRASVQAGPMDPLHAPNTLQKRFSAQPGDEQGLTRSTAGPGHRRHTGLHRCHPHSPPRQSLDTSHGQLNIVHPRGRPSLCAALLTRLVFKSSGMMAFCRNTSATATSSWSGGFVLRAAAIASHSRSHKMRQQRCGS